MKNFRTSKVQQIDWVSGARAMRELPKTVYNGIELKLFLTHASGSPTIKQLLDTLGNLEVTINGRNTVINIPAYHLYYMGLLDWHTAPRQSLASAGTASYVHVYLPFEMVGGVLPEDSLLNARSIAGVDSLVLAVNWSASVGALAISAGGLLINPATYGNVLADKRFASHEFSTFRQTIAGAGDVEIDIPVRGMNQYRRLFIYAYNSTPALDSGVISNFKLATDTFVYHDVEEPVLIARNNRIYQQASDVTGVYVLDLISHGMLSQRINASILDQLTLTLTAGEAGTAVIVAEKAIYSPE